MSRYWTCHWQNRLWRHEVNPEGQPLDSSGSNNFRKRGVSVGDVAYIVSLKAGQLYLGGRMTVKQIVSRQDAVRLFKTENLYEAEDWIIDPMRDGSPLHLHRRLSPAITKRLRFVSKEGPKEPYFVSDSALDNQATRGVRELTGESAALLDRIIEITDRLPTSGQLITATDQLIGNSTISAIDPEFRLPDEVPSGLVYNEGRVQRVEVNRYERDPRARAASIAAHGTNCSICGFDFEVVYGLEFQGYIHVHHVKALVPAKSPALPSSA
jgi:hypothetical protein